MQNKKIKDTLCHIKAKRQSLSPILIINKVNNLPIPASMNVTKTKMNNQVKYINVDEPKRKIESGQSVRINEKNSLYNFDSWKQQLE